MAHTQERGSIKELQEAFGILLQVRREKITPTHTHESNKSCHRFQERPKWTGAFRLFDFPRELRDQIYYQCVYRPKGITYRRTEVPFRVSISGTPDYLSLFLTCHQVYEEALRVFCRYNSIVISSRSRKSLDGTLRLFPDKPGRMLQRVGREYMNYNEYDWSLSEGSRNGPSGTWQQIVVDSRLTMEYFPLLREFTAIWHISPHAFVHDAATLRFEGKTEEERVKTWLEWIRFWYGVDRLVPPRCLRVDLLTGWQMLEMARCQDAFNEALENLRDEIRSSEVMNDLEESGKKWLEEAWHDEKKKKKRRKKVMGSDA